MPVDTTFLPKTNGLVFADRLTARADKGRVFLYTVAGDEIVEIVPNIEPLSVVIDGVPYDFENDDPIVVSLGGSKNVIVRSLGDATPTFAWTATGGDVVFTPADSGLSTLTFNSTGLIRAKCTLADVESVEGIVETSIFFLVT
ncbi:hypothetical protein P60_gp44 [Synechococcus phage P60]|uniref:Uncharacterized protein n=1 Tax=Synechococcus phage P60 TaxID=2905923 RepID=Q8W6W8_9CAUD|nr:hypothetical protein P60_gp44 [Synechococcus phage P60]AAL73311.1 hypothetical protein P60_gp44 [Synechococcus phage P60]